MKLGGIAERNAGEIRAVDLHDCEIGERIGADQFCREDPLVAHGDANIHGTFHHVVVSDNVTVGGNDHAAAKTVLNLRTRRLSEETEWSHAATEWIQLLRGTLIGTALLIVVVL